MTFITTTHVVKWMVADIVAIYYDVRYLFIKYFL